MENGDVGRVTFQAAKVAKPLLAVSAINAKGNPVWFDGVNSFIIPASAVELPTIRQNIQNMGKKIQLHMEQGTFRLKSWAKPSTPFRGQGW